VRGLARSLHSDFGFEPRNALLVDTDLNMAGYPGDKATAMQKRMIEAMAAIPGVDSVGLIGEYQPLNGGENGTMIFSDQTTDLRPSNGLATATRFSVYPDYLKAASTAVLAGRTFTWHDDLNSTSVAVVNREFAGKIFGSVSAALGGYFKTRGRGPGVIGELEGNGLRVQVVGVVEDGKYKSLTEAPEPAMFLPLLQAPSSETWMVLRSGRDPQQLASAIRSTMRELDSGLPAYVQTWDSELTVALFPSRMATISLGVLGVLGAMLSITGIFGMAAYSVSKRLRELGIRIALGAQPRQLLRAALGRPFKLLFFGSAAGLLLGILATRVLASVVYLATPRDPVVLTGVVLVMMLLGLLATWIPAQRAMSVDPVTLLREE
jgi:predicted permease